MGHIADWLKKIVTIIIFAGFLEMLLPNNNLKGVTRLCLGLLVMMVLLAPLIQIFNLPADLAQMLLNSTTDIQTQQQNEITGEILQAGQEMREDWEQVFKTHEEKYLIAKIEKSLSLIEDINLVRVRIRDSGLTVPRFILTVCSKRIQNSEQETDLEAQIRKLLYLTAGISAEQIEVEWDA